MCGAISLPYDQAMRESLLQFYSPQEIEKFSKAGEIIFAFWQKKPVLPIRDGKGIRLVEWGNRESQIKLPKTGWARQESENRWNYLHPTKVSIPAFRGCEKRQWFDLSSDILGILIHYNDLERVYMVTQKASQDYETLTHHDRMPVFRL